MHDHMNACCVNLLQAEKLVFSFALTDLQHGSGENLQEMDISALHEIAQEELRKHQRSWSWKMCPRILMSMSINIIETNDTGASNSYAQQLAYELWMHTLF